jgi:cytochrome c553
VPVLHGQSTEYLAASLQLYAAGRRKSGIMQPVATGLKAEQIGKVAAYYAKLPASVSRQPASKVSSTLENGRALAVDGLPAAGIPPCLACHGPQALSAYPRLAGQHADYQVGQLRLWQRGLRSGTDTAAIMAPIAMRLSDQQIKDVSHYFASMVPMGDSGRRP